MIDVQTAGGREIVGTDNAGGGHRALVLDGIEGLRARAGTSLGVSEWVDVEQEQVDAFARLTGDEQWIHVDPERAKNGPFGATVAHGFFTLGRSTGLLWNVAVVENAGVNLNYGLNKVRFPAPVKVGSRIRMHVSVADVRDVPGGAEAIYHLEYEIEGEHKPPCVADLVFRYYPEPAAESS
jgi:acyl dehydratase